MALLGACGDQLIVVGEELSFESAEVHCHGLGEVGGHYFPTFLSQTCQELL